jgi:YegS/Rv2252/BmrU family lipid kinase
LLYNPAAGRFPLSEKRLKALLKTLYDYGIRAETAITQPSQETSLNLENKDLLIIYGGDGTLHEAIPEAVKWQVPVALLPAGTTNVLARELGIPRNPERALSLVSQRKLLKIHLGWGDWRKSGTGLQGPVPDFLSPISPSQAGRYFHLMAGVGFDGDVISRTSQHLKKALGMVAYWLVAHVSLLKYPMTPFELSLEGEVHQGTFAVIGNARKYGGELHRTPKASVQENCLDVCLFTSRQRWRYLLYLWGVLSGRHLRYPDVLYRKVQHLKVSSDRPVPIQMDGELIGHSPMEFSSCREGLEVVVP